MGCNSPGATHHAACDCREAEWQRRLDAALDERDSYRASAELRVGMRREFEELLGCGDTTAPETFEAGLVRLRALLAAEAKAERLAKALRLAAKYAENCNPESGVVYFGVDSGVAEWQRDMAVVRAALAEVGE